MRTTSEPVHSLTVFTLSRLLSVSAPSGVSSAAYGFSGVSRGWRGGRLVSVLATALFCIALGGVYGPAHFVPIYKTSHIEEDRHTGLAV